VSLAHGLRPMRTRTPGCPPGSLTASSLAVTGAPPVPRSFYLPDVSAFRYPVVQCGCSRIPEDVRQPGGALRAPAPDRTGDLRFTGAPLLPTELQGQMPFSVMLRTASPG
jgi:hypothetical protein